MIDYETCQTMSGQTNAYKLRSKTDIPSGFKKPTKMLEEILAQCQVTYQTKSDEQMNSQKKT